MAPDNPHPSKRKSTKSVLLTSWRYS